MKAQEFVRPGDRVGVAVSGGADSVALFLLLLELREKLGMVLSVVHFNHKLRGKASDDDVQFVANLGDKYGLEIHCDSLYVVLKTAKNRSCLAISARGAHYVYS